jgi:hypothetical protein
MLQLIYNEDDEDKAEAEPAFHDAIQGIYKGAIVSVATRKQTSSKLEKVYFQAHS